MGYSSASPWPSEVLHTWQNFFPVGYSMSNTSRNFKAQLEPTLEANTSLAIACETFQTS